MNLLPTIPEWQHTRHRGKETFSGSSQIRFTDATDAGESVRVVQVDGADGESTNFVQINMPHPAGRASDRDTQPLSPHGFSAFVTASVKDLVKSTGFVGKMHLDMAKLENDRIELLAAIVEKDGRFAPENHKKPKNPPAKAPAGTKDAVQMHGEHELDPVGQRRLDDSRVKSSKTVEDSDDDDDDTVH